MAYIPKVERIEESQCSVCSHICARLCVTCGTAFCNKHLLSHASLHKQAYRKIVRTILRDGLTDVAKHLVSFTLTTVWYEKIPWRVREIRTKQLKVVGRTRRWNV